MTEARIFALQCPSCGAGLSVASSLDVFSCSYCGATIKLAQSGGTVALELLGRQLAGVQRGTDKTAAELALRRLSDELAVLNAEADQLNRHRAWRAETLAIEKDEIRERNGHVLMLAIVAVVIYIMGSGMMKLLLSFLNSDHRTAAEPHTWIVVWGLVIAATFFSWLTLERGLRRRIASIDATWQANAVAAQIKSTMTRIGEARRVVDV
jgi:hypothetical protein